MADKSIGELVEATVISGEDLFLLQQSNNAKKLKGQTLENWLLKMADGHGGIHGIAKTSTDKLVDTYTITYADQSTSTFVVNNGRGIQSFEKIETSGLDMTWRMTYNDGTSKDIVISNGAKGDKGDNAYIHIRWSAQMPTAASHSMGDIPDAYIGIYSGPMESAPSDWTQYKWFKYKGDKGDTGEAANIVSTAIEYQVSNQGVTPPGGSWQNTIPNVQSGQYLWTRTKIEFNSGDPVISYSVARNGINGTGSVSTVNGISPNVEGNVTLTAQDVGAHPDDWMPTATDVGARPDDWIPTTEDIGAASSVQLATYVRPNLLDNWYFKNPVNQRGVSGTVRTAGYFIDRWKLISGNVQITANGLILNGKISQILEFSPGADVKASVLTTSGIVDGEYDANTKTFSITATGKTIIAAKLELGNTQTLAHLENGVWVLNEIPDHGDQLAKCLRYFYSFNGNFTNALAIGAGYYSGYFQFPIPMRATPSYSNLVYAHKTSDDVDFQSLNEFGFNLYCSRDYVTISKALFTADL